MYKNEKQLTHTYRYSAFDKQEKGLSNLHVYLYAIRLHFGFTVTA